MLLFGGLNPNRLISGEETDVVSNSYAEYYSVRSSLRKTGNDGVNLVI